MSTLLDDVDSDTTSPAANRLRTTMAAVRLSFTWLGVRKTLTPEQKAQAAESFGAEGRFLSAGKKLLDTAHPAYKAVTQVRSRAVHVWKGMSLPYPEPGVRLIRQDRIEAFDQQLSALRAELTEAVQALDERYSELKAAARRRLGNLYNAADYPGSLREMFAVEWDFPSIEPPDYLRQLNPELYEQEARRVAARFDEAVQLAEAAFAAEFSQLLAHLSERLSGTQDGKPKVFRDSAVTNLRAFFERFRELSVGSSAELERLVTEAQQLTAGVTPQDLRDQSRLRQRMTRELARPVVARRTAGGPPAAEHSPAQAVRGGGLMELLIRPSGNVRCVYGEAIDLRELGTLSVRRASHVEPDEQGRWHADLSPVGGPRLGPYSCRSAALQAEEYWLTEHWLPRGDSPS